MDDTRIGGNYTTIAQIISRAACRGETASITEIIAYARVLGQLSSRVTLHMITIVTHYVRREE